MMDPDERLSDPRRIRVIDEILVAHDRDDWDFDRFTQLAKALLEVPICLVSLVTSDRQVFAGACGLPAGLEELRETPLSHSICQHAVTRRSMLVIGDTMHEPVISEILSVREYEIRAYLGCPLMTNDGHVLGSFCAIDHIPREWTHDEIDRIRDFAALVVQKIEGKMLEDRHRNAFDVMIHDLKTPLSGILMASALLHESEDAIPERLRPLLEAIGEEGAKALRLVEVLAKESLQEMSGVCMDPGQVIRMVADRWVPLASAKNIAIETEVEEGAIWSVDSWVIEQVLENLLGNAVKYSPPGGRIRVRSHGEGRLGHLTVTDEGPGFSEEDRKMIFKRYTRLSARPTGDESSTGLGLSIVKRLVDQHRGQIELMSPVGSGAEFRISFSQAAAEPVGCE